MTLNMAISVLGLLTDIAILLLPVPVVLRLQTDVRRRGENHPAPLPFSSSIRAFHSASPPPSLPPTPPSPG